MEIINYRISEGIYILLSRVFLLGSFILILILILSAHPQGCSFSFSSCEQRRSRASLVATAYTDRSVCVCLPTGLLINGSFSVLTHRVFSFSFSSCEQRRSFYRACLVATAYTDRSVCVCLPTGLLINGSFSVLTHRVAHSHSHSHSRTLRASLLIKRRICPRRTC